MRLEWLEDILAVAESGSFSEAAVRRHLTQSAFSRRVQMIEDLVGVELFDRSHKPVTLRPTTADQRERIGQLAGALRQLVADLQLGDRKSTNRIVLASQHALTTSLTPEVVRRVQDRHPDTYVRLRSMNFDDCFNVLMTRQADIALVYRALADLDPVEPSLLDRVSLGRDDLVPVFSRTHLASLSARLAAGELPVIVYPSAVFFGRILDRTVLPQLATLARALPKAETALTLAAVELAAVGVGVAWVPRALTAEPVAAGRLVDLSDRLPACPLELTAIRLPSDSGGVAASVWQQLERWTQDATGQGSTEGSQEA